MKTVSFCLTLVLLGTLPAYCADAPLPNAKDVLNRFVEVTGGVKAYEKNRNRRERTKLVASFQPGTATSMQENAYPDLVRGRVRQPDGRVTEWGHCSGVSWLNDGDGHKILTGEEAEWTKLYANISLDMEWPKRCSDLNVVATTSFDGIDCYRVDAKTKAGLSLTQYFEVKTGLRRGVVDERPIPHGTRRSTRVFTDYRNIDGLLIPHKMVSKNLIIETGVEWTTTVKTTSIKHNIDFPKEHFEPPAEIRALLTKTNRSAKDES